MLTMRFYRHLAARVCPWAWLCWDMTEGIKLMDKLTEEAIEEGVNTPFVQELLKELHRKRKESRDLLVSLTAQGEVTSRLHALGGKAAAYEDIIRTIENAKGKDVET